LNTFLRGLPSRWVAANEGSDSWRAFDIAGHLVIGERTDTLAQLLATWAAHDLTHLHQLSRVMAYQYRDAVGPWTVFLGVMHCTGHSAP